MKGYKEQRICGHTKDIMFDGKVKKLNIELVRHYWEVETDGYYTLHFEDDTKKDKKETILSKPLFVLHLGEATELKSIIDELIRDSLENETEKLREEVNELKEQVHELTPKPGNRRME